METCTSSRKISRECDRLLVIDITHLFLIVLREAHFVLGEGASVTLIEGSLRQFNLLLSAAGQVKQLFLVIFALILLDVKWIISNVVLFLLLGEHLVEQFFDLLAVFAVVAVAVTAVFAAIFVGATHVFFHNSIEVLTGISHKYVVAALITFIGLAQFVDFFQGLGLLVFLCVQTGMHIEVRYLLFGVQGHILVLLDGHFFIDFEDRSILEVQVDILEGEDCFHCHE